MNKLEIIIGGHTFFEGDITDVEAEMHIDGWVRVMARFPAVEADA